jgi:hypothetical protein
MDFLIPILLDSILFYQADIAFATAYRAFLLQNICAFFYKKRKSPESRMGFRDLKGKNKV